MSVIADLRAKLNMTQDEFAEHCGVSRISIARYEAGAKISRANAIKIAKACGTTIDYVLYDPNEEAEEIEIEEADAGDDQGVTLTDDEYHVICVYRTLNEKGKDYIRDQLAIAQKIYEQSGAVSVAEVDVG